MKGARKHARNAAARSAACAAGAACAAYAGLDARRGGLAFQPAPAARGRPLAAAEAGAASAAEAPAFAPAPAPAPALAPALAAAAAGLALAGRAAAWRAAAGQRGASAARRAAAPGGAAEAPPEPAAEAPAEPAAEAPAEPVAEAQAEGAEPKGAADAEAGAEGEEDAEAEAEAEGDAAPEAKAKKPEKWQCSSCGALNFAAASECSKCGGAKPSRAEAALMMEKDAAQDDVSKIMDEFIRLQADLQNYRRQHGDSLKRTETLGKQDALRRLVPFTLDLEKALVAPEGMAEKEAKIFESYSLLFKKVLAVWDKFGVEAMEVAEGDTFDTKRHRKAESREAEGEQTPGTILEVLERGWTVEGQVLIPAEVAIVAFPEAESEAASEEEASDESGDDAEAEEGSGDAEQESEREEVAA